MPLASPYSSSGPSSIADLGFGLVQTAAPAEEPVTLAELKNWLRMEHTDADDAKVAALGAAARDWVERVYSRQLVQATWKLTLDRFPPAYFAIRLPVGPAVAVTGVTYVDSGGATRTVSTSVYQLSSLRDPAWLLCQDGQGWPTDVKPNRLDAVSVTFTAGYSPTAAGVPEVAKTAIKMLAAILHRNPEPLVVGGGAPAELPFTITALLSSIWSGSYGL